MHSAYGIAAPPASEAPSTGRRVHYRHPIQSLVYVTLDDGNGGIIRNLSQDGAAIQAVAALRPNQSLRMRFDLLNPRTRVDVHARVTWANSTGQAGLCFTDLSKQARRHVNDWIFLNLLRGFEESTHAFRPEERDDLILSAGARPAIRVSAAAAMLIFPPVSASTMSFPWWPRPMSSRSLAKLTDGLVLLSAVLMFFCAFLVVAGTLPEWPVAITLVAGVSGFFTALYWWVCAWLGCGTLGVRLARMAVNGSDNRRVTPDEGPRFR